MHDHEAWLVVKNSQLTIEGTVKAPRAMRAARDGGAISCDRNHAIRIKNPARGWRRAQIISLNFVNAPSGSDLSSVNL
jgi:hypothetical protein